ncbi:hypothetical protein D9615_005952 [Tricholomella constricta]|uniref:Cytochrome P450 n=1 Tax=Tricholomella constricta TaxID=117010 RepID=A0A8H5H9A7_9AGAR|nr:hypothetical protein D9615_005952 [Tricholomella constricta]
MALRLLNDFRTNFFSFQFHFLGHDISLLPTLLVIFVTSRVIKLLKGIHAVNYLPGFRVPFQPLAIPGAILPTTSWNFGPSAHWNWRSTVYKTFGSEIFSVIPFLVGAPSIYTSSIEVARQVVSGEQKGSSRSFQKSEFANRVLIKWGMNLVGALDGHVWRKHRRVVGPAYELVWTETLNTYRQMEAGEGWDAKDTIDVPSVGRLTTKLALLVIAKCGFGFSFDWSAPPTGPDGKMSVQKALSVLSKSHLVALMAPDWVRYLPLPGFAQIREAFDQFSGFMQREFEARVAEVRNEEQSADERIDAFTMLVRANEQQTGKLCLNNQEVIGNVFIMLFAGHETTAHTLETTLALLALHQDLQNEVYEQIVSVVGYDRDPKFEDYANLDKVLHAFYEALRLFPTAYLLIREAAEDTVLQVPNPVGQEGSTPYPVPKGTRVIIDMISLHYNERYFADPTAFKPSRWSGTSSESEALFSFSVGPRACIGRKFALTEAVAFLTMLLRDWRVEPAFKEDESREAWRERVMGTPDLVLTLSVKEAPVRLTRRRPGRG